MHMYTQTSPDIRFEAWGDWHGDSDYAPRWRRRLLAYWQKPPGIALIFLKIVFYLFLSLPLYSVYDGLNGISSSLLMNVIPDIAHGNSEKHMLRCGVADLVQLCGGLCCRSGYRCAAPASVLLSTLLYSPIWVCLYYPCVYPPSLRVLTRPLVHVFTRALVRLA